ncbi:MAG: phosphatidate cytidylyltransferase [Deltaproteobacteria bacterium]|nr:MAG: phosphatidate cytidylyltransferase [Deltaproteobacteria bacterium]
MHLKRWLTALVALPFLIFLILKGGAFLFWVLIAGVSVLALHEYHGMLFPNVPITAPFRILNLATAPVMVAAAALGGVGGLSAGLVVGLFAAAFLGFREFTKTDNFTDLFARQILGLIYIPFLLSFLMMLRLAYHGVSWVFLVLFLVAAADTGAYYAGTYFGSLKLCPDISPGKTVEGFAGGVGLSVVAAFLFKLIFFPAMGWGMMIVMGTLIPVIAPVGDLFESVQKRLAGVKDSGALLPGHGGLLDRIDALLFAAPVAYGIHAWLV